MAAFELPPRGTLPEVLRPLRLRDPPGCRATERGVSERGTGYRPDAGSRGGEAGWQCRSPARTAETTAGRCPDRRWSMNASTSAACHCHGYSLAKTAKHRTRSMKRRTRSIPDRIVCALRNRVRGCMAQPSNTVSNTAGAASGRTTPEAGRTQNLEDQLLSSRGVERDVDASPTRRPSSPRIQDAREGADRWSAPSLEWSSASSAADAQCCIRRSSAHFQLQPLVEPQPSQM